MLCADLVSPVTVGSQHPEIPCPAGYSMSRSNRPTAVIAGQSASKTRVNALVTRQSIVFARTSREGDGPPGQARGDADGWASTESRRPGHAVGLIVLERCPMAEI